MDWRLGPNWSELESLSVEKVVMGDAAFFAEEFRGAIFLRELIFFQFVEILAGSARRHSRSRRTSVSPPLLPTTKRVGALLPCTKLSR